MSFINNNLSKNINIISFIISKIIFFIINSLINNFSKAEKNQDEIDYVQTNIVQKKSEKEDDELNWYIEIPSINLKAPIKETTYMDVLDKYVGHFKETPLTEGNVCLAGHNRGYEKNYFENLKNIQKGDKIIYKYNEFKKEYIVNTIENIKETNWNYIENTSDNKITLITCVENKPEYRRCVQATKKLE